MTRKPKPYAEEVKAVKEQIRKQIKETTAELRKRKLYFVLRFVPAPSFYIGINTEYDGGGRSYYSSWHIHLTEDYSSANMKRFETIQEAVKWQKWLPIETKVDWKAKG